MLLSFSCSMNTDNNISNVENTSIKIWAHRGCSYKYPENTLAAFEAACKVEGITGIELDIQLTKDGEIVVIHDETLDRTTNGSGNVRDFTLVELKKLKIPREPFFGIKRYTTEKIPTIQEVFETVKPYCLSNGLLINIELKNSNIRYEGMEQKILSLVSEYSLEDYIVYSSFNPDSILLLRQIQPSVKIAILNSSEQACLDFAMEHDVDALHPYIKKLDVDDIQSKTSLPIRAWNGKPDEPFFPSKDSYVIQDLRALESVGVTDIFTNIPEAYSKHFTHDTVSPVLETGHIFNYDTGVYETCETSVAADFHFYEVNAGDEIAFNADDYMY